MKNLKYIIYLLPLIVGCKKLIEVGTPQNQLTTDKVFSDTASATAAMVNVYAVMDKRINPNYNKYMGVYTDELIYPGSSPDIVQFSTSKLTSTNSISSTFWTTCYSAIYACNQIIEQLAASKNLPTATITTLTAEARFLRAYCYFYLTNSFGPVPLILTTNINQTAKASRTDSAQVYNQIVQDLLSAQNLLSGSYIGGEKTRANKWSATALLARVDLYQHNWQDAEKQATAIINSGQYSLNTPSTVFLANSNETILAIWTQYGYISDATSLVPNSGAPNYPVAANLVSAFEQGDLRKASWLGSTTVTSGGSSTVYYYPFKYHNRTNNTSSPEYLNVLRLAELYLIRSEAFAHEGNIAGAVQDLNTIRERAGLDDLSPAISQTVCSNDVAQEWRVEFCFEWGHRSLDLKRQGLINQVMSTYKPTWGPNADLLPIPKNDLTYDPYLNQNTGY
jgi:hypothetical protein